MCKEIRDWGMDMRKWIMAGMMLLGLVVGTTRVQAAEAELVIKEEAQQYQLAVTNKKGDLLNLEPGAKLPEETITLANETSKKTFNVMMRQAVSDDWLMDYLQGTVSVGDEVYTLAEIMSGVEVTIWPGVKTPVTTHLFLAGGELGKDTRQAKSTMTLDFTITEEGVELPMTANSTDMSTSQSSSSQSSHANYAGQAPGGKLPTTGSRMGQFATLGGCIVIGGALFLLRNRKDERFHK